MANKYWKKASFFSLMMTRNTGTRLTSSLSNFMWPWYNILVVENDQKRDDLYTCSNFLVLVFVISINLKNIYLTNKFRGPNTRSIYTI